MANSSIIEKAKNFVAKNKGKIAALAALGAVGAAGVYVHNKGYFNQSADVNTGGGSSTGKVPGDVNATSNSNGAPDNNTSVLDKVPGGGDVRKVNDIGLTGSKTPDFSERRYAQVMAMLKNRNS